MRCTEPVSVSVATEPDRRAAAAARSQPRCRCPSPGSSATPPHRRGRHSGMLTAGLPVHALTDNHDFSSNRSHQRHTRSAVSATPSRRDRTRHRAPRRDAIRRRSPRRTRRPVSAARPAAPPPGRCAHRLQPPTGGRITGGQVALARRWEWIAQERATSSVRLPAAFPRVAANLSRWRSARVRRQAGRPHAGIETRQQRCGARLASGVPASAASPEMSPRPSSTPNMNLPGKWANAGSD